MAISEDNKEFFETEEYTKLLSILDRARSELWIMEENSKTIKYDGIGSIAAITDGNMETSFYLILKALKTHNKLVLFSNDKIRESTRKIIQIVNSVCNEEKYNTYIGYCEYNDIEELFENSNQFDVHIFINVIDKYRKFKEKARYHKVIYSSFGTMSLYLDNKNLKSELLNMDDYVFNNNIDLDLIKETTVEEAVERINKNTDNYSAVIFTKDTQKAYYFIENVKAKQIFVNRNPGNDYVFEMDDTEFVVKKRVFI